VKNYWLSVTDTLHADIVAYAIDPETYPGTVPAADASIFAGGVADFNTVTSLYKPFSSKNLYSFYTADQSVIDDLLIDYPTTVLLGSWDSDGVRLSTLSGDLLNYMPDIFDVPTQQFVSATVLTDVNVLFGQPQRSFI